MASHCNQILIFYHALSKQHEDNYNILEAWGILQNISNPGDLLQRQPSLVSPQPPRTTSCPHYSCIRQGTMGPESQFNLT
jgi:hypothetical protein